MVRRRGWIGRRAHATDPRTREARLSLPTLLFSLWLCLTTTRATAQPPWTDLPAPPIDALVEAPQGALPGVRWVRFDLESLAATLASAPGEDQRAPARVVLPMPAGSMEFDVRAATLFEPALARAWSDCRAFVGLGPSGERVRLELTPRGVSAWIRARTPEGALDDVWIDPATRSDPSLGIAYRPKDLPARAWACRTGEPDQPDAPLFQTVHVQGVVRTYRLAVAATGEYTDIQGGVVQARSAITTLVSRLNMMFES